MNIVSWNINGFRAVLKKGFNDFLEKYNPDIIALQEIKMSKEVIAKENIEFANYDIYWHPALRPGYSGTALLIKKKLKPIQVQVKSGDKAFDSEGRIQIVECNNFYLLNAYFPNANNELSRLDFKVDFNKHFLKQAKKLEKKKPVILCGDFNVAHQEIDLARPKENVGNAGFTEEERLGMDEFIKKEFIDTFRYFYPNEKKYSWWSYRGGARFRNVGWRIDYFLVSKKIISRVKNVFILNEVMGSDHCPIGIELNI